MATTSDSATFRIRDSSGVYRSVPQKRLIKSAKHCILQRFNRDAITIGSPKDTEDYLQTLLADLEHEVFGFIFLDNRHRVSRIIPWNDRRNLGVSERMCKARARAQFGRGNLRALCAAEHNGNYVSRFVMCPSRVTD